MSRSLRVRVRPWFLWWWWDIEVRDYLDECVYRAHRRRGFASSEASARYRAARALDGYWRRQR